jgi:DHA2 family multidrug resistance protein-like MFS transporter
MTTLSTDIMVGMAPPERAGAASSISETSSELGGALGIAVLGSVGTAVYRGQLAGAIPVGVPVDAARAALSTLGGAAAVADRLPHPFGIELLRSAREAFAQSFEVTAGISAAIAIVTAIVAAVLLRRVGAPTPEEHQRDADEDPTAV